MRYFCSPQHTDSALYPIISQMERAAGFTHEDTPQAKLDKLDALLAKSVDCHARTQRSSPKCCRYRMTDVIRPLSWPRSNGRQKTLEALTAQMEALSHQKHVLMIFEDAHWADPTSLEAFGRSGGPHKNSSACC